MVRSIAVVCVLAACGGSAAREETTPSPPAQRAAAAVELAEITVLEHDRPMVRLHADGSSEITSQLRDVEEPPAGMWDPGPTVHADGVVTFKGVDIARINADGTIVNLETQTNLPVLVTPDGVTTTRAGPPKGFALAASGQLSSVDGDVTTEIPIRVEGAATPGQRRTALAFLVLVFGRSDAVPGT
jgi:hypothetical protein